MQPILIVGAGLSGAVLAREFADAAIPVIVFERSAHPAGHCHTARDQETGIMVHVFGPHIFHSDDAATWQFVSRFGTFRPFNHTVKSSVAGRQYPFPINLVTLQEFFGSAFTPEQARAFLRKSALVYGHTPANFEEQALASVGPALYEAFYRGYTQKQWGRPPRELPASIFSRIPVRFSDDNNYFHHRCVGIPEDGYTALIERMLNHRLIDIKYGRPFVPARDLPGGFAHVFHTGELDGFFDFKFGRLPYRSLRFEHFRMQGEYQSTVTVNYPDLEVPFTRITEQKKLTPWEDHDASICTREYPMGCGPSDRPFYPVNLAAGSEMLERYVAEAQGLRGVSFVGRLATFRYIDMDVAIQRARHAATTARGCLGAKTPIPAFF
jgi:UDP-galactopyranose mutase